MTKNLTLRKIRELERLQQEAQQTGDWTDLGLELTNNSIALIEAARNWIQRTSEPKNK